MEQREITFNIDLPNSTSALEENIRFMPSIGFNFDGLYKAFGAKFIPPTANCVPITTMSKGAPIIAIILSINQNAREE